MHVIEADGASFLALRPDALYRCERLGKEPAGGAKAFEPDVRLAALEGGRSLRIA